MTEALLTLFPAPLHRAALRAGLPLAKAWWRLVPTRTEGAVAALWRGSRLLIVRGTAARTVSLPGGFLKRGEDPGAGARRELREETGLDLPADAFKAQEPIRTSYGRRRNTAHLFEVDCAAIEAQTAPLLPRPDDREIAWARFLTLSELVAYTPDPTLKVYLERLEG